LPTRSRSTSHRSHRPLNECAAPSSAEEHTKTLTAALEISPREAIEGATVPSMSRALHVPHVRRTRRDVGAAVWGVRRVGHRTDSSPGSHYDPRRRRRRGLLPFLRCRQTRPFHADRTARPRQSARPRLGGNGTSTSSRFSVRSGARLRCWWRLAAAVVRRSARDPVWA
jgi:hypothetical protein